MLVLMRRWLEKVVLSDADGTTIATIQVVRMGRSMVWLGFDAPKEVNIARSELLQDKESKGITHDK